LNPNSNGVQRSMLSCLSVRGAILARSRASTEPPAPSQNLFGRYSINDTSQTRPNLDGTSSPNFLISNPTAGNDFLRQQQVTVDDTIIMRPRGLARNLDAGRSLR
jgi:hypothetical protein